MTYNVFSGTLNPTHFTSPQIDTIYKTSSKVKVTGQSSRSHDETKSSATAGMGDRG